MDNSVNIDFTPTTATDQTFFEGFSTERFFYEDLGLNEEEIELLHNTSFFNNNPDYDNYYIERTADRIINKAIINATEQRLEMHSVLLYLRDTSPHLTHDGDKSFYTHFVNPEFKQLKNSFSEDGKIAPKEFLSLLLLADINSRYLQAEANDRISSNEQPSEVFVDIAKRVLEK